MRCAIGVARSVRTANLSRLDPNLGYLPIEADALQDILIRVQGEPADALAAVRQTLASLDETIPATLWMMSLEQGPLRFERVQAQIWGMSADRTGRTTPAVSGSPM